MRMSIGLDELAVDLLEDALHPVARLPLRARDEQAREVQPEVVRVAVDPHVGVEELGDLAARSLVNTLARPQNSFPVQAAGRA